MSERIRILAVDDSQSTLEVLKRNLESNGYEVFTALRVAEALSLLDSLDIDLVITDYRMPQATGLDLIRHVRDNYPDTRNHDDYRLPLHSGGGGSHQGRCG